MYLVAALFERFAAHGALHHSLVVIMLVFLIALFGCEHFVTRQAGLSRVADNMPAA